MSDNVTQRTTGSLYEPYKLKNLFLDNRIVMAPMTRSFSPNGVPSTDVAQYYRRRAEHSVGLIITEGTVINHAASTGDPKIPHFYGKDALAGWTNVVNAVHGVSGKIMPQLWHEGMLKKIGERNSDVLPVGPSGLVKPGIKVSEPLSESEIATIIESFAAAALDAKNIGFDGIELHGAHGYLIDQFLWEGTNQRTDRYGGDLVRRTQFAADIIRACRRTVGSDFPIVFRFSQWKIQDFNAKLANTPDELEQLLEPLVLAGADAFHCSTRRFWEPEFEGHNLSLAGWVKKLTGKTTITVGSVGLDGDFIGSLAEGKNASITSIDELIDMLERGDFDLVAIGRALLADSEWAEKVRDHRFQEIRAFNIEVLSQLV